MMLVQYGQTYYDVSTVRSDSWCDVSTVRSHSCMTLVQYDQTFMMLVQYDQTYYDVSTVRSDFL
jgi:hypothetical protein